MPYTRYELDPHNKLIVRETGKRTPVRRFRKVTGGTLRIGAHNTLLYHIKSPDDAGNVRAPHQIKFKGTWSLTRNHDLRLTLNKWRRQRPGDELTVKGELIGADAHHLVFAATGRTGDVSATRILKLEGEWSVDKNNRLSFRAKKEGGRHDLLTLTAAWKCTSRQQIQYTYTKKEGKRSARQGHTISFSGRWDLPGPGVLRYILDVEGSSTFDFHIKKSWMRKGKLCFEIGVRVAGRAQPVRRKIVLDGTWKVTKRNGLFFELISDRGTFYRIYFGSRIRLKKSGRLEVCLFNTKDTDLGIRVTLTKTLLAGDGELLVKMLASRKEKAAYLAYGARW